MLKTGKPYNIQVDVYSFAITLLEIGCRDHRFVVTQFQEQSAKERIGVGLVAVDCTDHVGFRPIPKEKFVEALPELWALVSHSESDPPKGRVFIKVTPALFYLAG